MLNDPESAVNDTEEIGEISSNGGHLIEWTIGNFFSYEEVDKSFKSPTFDVSGSRWYLEIFPSGKKTTDKVDWIALYLYRKVESSAPQGARYTFGIKRTDGKVEEPKGDICWVFHDKQMAFGWSTFLKRSELVRRRSELAPSGALTVTCTIWVHEDIECSDSMEMLSRNLLDMFISERGCDATLKVKEKEFRVHKNILSARSPVFAAMFEADMKEKRSGVVDIMDCDPGAFKDFLAYLYSGRAENLANNAFEIVKIAEKYDVKRLKSDCLIYIMLNLSLENFCDVVVLGHQFSIEEFKFKTKHFFNRNFDKIISTAKWESLIESNGLLANELLKKLASEMKFIHYETLTDVPRKN